MSCCNYLLLFIIGLLACTSDQAVRFKNLSIYAVSISFLLFKDVECYARGECGSSQFKAFAVLDTPKECHQFCLEQDTFFCNYFTHYIDESNGGCFAYVDCKEILDNCLDCVTGRADCPLLGEVSTFLPN